MRLITFFIVVIISSIHCAQINLGEIKENQNLDKGLKLDNLNKYSVFRKNAKKSLEQLRKETTLERLRKRCDSCRDASLCKVYRKCDLCVKICTEYENALSSYTVAPVVGSIKFLNNDKESNNAPKSVETLKSGSQEDLVFGLLKIVRKNGLDKIITLAKPKRRASSKNNANLFQIDSLNTFNKVRVVDGNNVSPSVDEELTTRINQNIDEAINEKIKTTGNDHLSSEEVDKIIDDSLSMFNYKQISSNTLNPVKQNEIQFQSRSNFDDSSNLEIQNNQEQKSTNTQFNKNRKHNQFPIKRTIFDKNQPLGFAMRTIKNNVTHNTCVGKECSESIENQDDGDNSDKHQLIKNESHSKSDTAILDLSHPSDIEESAIAQFSNTTNNQLTNPPIMLNTSNTQDTGGFIQISTESNFQDNILSMSAPSSINAEDNESIDTDKNSKKPEESILFRGNPDFINTSFFTKILKNLEKKVESIADLVTKTCGDSGIITNHKDPESINNSDILNSPNLGSKTPAQAIAEKPVDDAISHLKKDAGILIDRVLDIAENLQNENPLQVTSSPVGKPNTANELREFVGGTITTTAIPIFATSNHLNTDNVTVDGVSITPKEGEAMQNDTVTCSDDSEENVGISLENVTPTLLNRFASEEQTSDVTINNQPLKDDEDVGYPKEASEESVGDKTNVPRTNFHIPTNTDSGIKPINYKNFAAPFHTKHQKGNLLAKPFFDQNILDKAPANRQLQTDNLQTPLSNYDKSLPSKKFLQKANNGDLLTPLVTPKDSKYHSDGLPRAEDIVGTTNDNNKPNDHEAIPFKSFGRIVQLQNGTEADLEDAANGKIYFVASGMRLPLSMKKDQDGFYQLFVDVDRLCDKCKESKCNRNELTRTSNVNTHQPDTSNKEHDIEKRKIKSFDEVEIIKANTHQQKNTVLDDKYLNQFIVKQDPYSHVSDTPQYGNIKQSRTSKRSPSLDFLSHKMQYADNNSEDNSKNVNVIENSKTRKNFHDADENLKQIDKNMKQYYNKRYKLDSHYKTENNKDLENPNTEKDIVKRRVTLLNSVLSWMKDIALEKVHI